MEMLLFFVVLAFVLLLSIFLFLLYQKIGKLGQAGDTRQTFEVMSRWMEQMQQRLDRNADVLERGMRQTESAVAARLDKTGELLGVVGERIGEMSEIGRSMRDIGDLLKSPKLRGNIGEFVLKDLLKQYLPQSSFSLQYPFSSGVIVDAVIRTEQGILCIDSKFPFENFKKMYGADVDVTKAKILVCNASSNFCFQGQTHGDKGFLLEGEDLEAFLKDKNASKYLHPFLTGEELLDWTKGQPWRYVIDLNEFESLEKAKAAGIAFDRVKELVYPGAKAKADKEEKKLKDTKAPKPRANHLTRWWRFWRAREDMVTNVTKHARYIVCSRVTRRPIFSFVSSEIRPNDALQVFAADDNYSFGILSSTAHAEWFKAKCSLDSTLKCNTLAKDLRWG
jgi:hypothetical protein